MLQRLQLFAARILNFFNSSHDHRELKQRHPEVFRVRDSRAYYRHMTNPKRSQFLKQKIVTNPIFRI